MCGFSAAIDFNFVILSDAVAAATAESKETFGREEPWFSFCARRLSSRRWPK